MRVKLIAFDLDGVFVEVVPTVSSAYLEKIGEVGIWQT